MAVGTGRSRGHLLALVIAAMVFAIAIGVVAPAFAQTTIDDSSLVIDLGGQVYAENCDPCHGNIANTKNFSSEIIFQHGYHQLVACSSCHTRFPHRPEGTERPTMKLCFNCHGLRHGPMGELATGKCEDCHHTPRNKLRPSDHTWDWAKKPHVQPGETQLQTRCMMCHDKAWCVDCHDKNYIRWQPSVPYTYDSTGGCLACHGNENLTKSSAGQPKSYMVQGVDQSAHSTLSCQQCHKDYRYGAGTDPTALWQVNAGLACLDCHSTANATMFTDKAQADASKKVVADYQKSIHWTKLQSWLKGDQKPAVAGAANQQPPTCSDCHGGHYIQRTDTAYAKQVLHGSAYRMCARCHPTQYASYDDYYHGAAYKKGATDAPACWDCHGSHDVLPAKDPASTVSAANLPKTCGQEGCHKGGSAENFTAQAGKLIHQKVQAAETNPIRQLLQRIGSWFS